LPDLPDEDGADPADAVGEYKMDVATIAGRATWRICESRQTVDSSIVRSSRMFTSRSTCS
jgi:hypothetical protein